MRDFLLEFAALMLGLGLAGCTLPPDDALARTAIEHVAAFEGTGDDVLPDHTVVIEGDRILWVGGADDAPRPRASRHIEGHGRTLIPGLGSAHPPGRPGDVASGPHPVRDVESVVTSGRVYDRTALDRLATPAR